MNPLLFCLKMQSSFTFALNFSDLITQMKSAREFVQSVSISED